MMKIHALLAVFLVSAPVVVNAEISFDSLKEGAAKAAKAVGDTTKGAVDAAGEAGKTLNHARPRSGTSAL